jgi:predicted DnaQ family exonuclease/DinG family helicase
MENIYISLDLETTGFDPVGDQVLEVAAIKFQGNKILETFETLINPGIEIPAMVTHITGITEETVADAPSFESISDNLAKFLGNFPIVGHNIEFDLTFLEAKGIPILNSQLDTLKLSSILIHDLPSYSLDTISRLLKIEHKNKHRAYSDAFVCFKLIQILKKKIAELPPKTLEQIKEIVPRANWDLGEIFLQSKSNTTPKKTVKKKKKKSHTTNLGKQLKNDSELIDLLGEKSPLQNIIKNYEHRPGQQTLLQKILDAVHHRYHLIAEAGTGTGKTMAYLLAAAHIKHSQHKKVIISTYTNNLQDQIVNKDFPLIKHLFPDLKIAVLKGRKKYFDQERFKALTNKHHLEEHQLTTIIKVLIWLEQTETGDLDEINLQNKEILLYDEICSNPDDKRKNKNRTTESYLEKARKKADTADIVVVNHALLIQDHLNESSILPNAEILVVDEAHHLEKTLTDALTTQFSHNRTYRLWEKLIEHLHHPDSKKVASDPDWELHIENTKKLRLSYLSISENIFDGARLVIEKYAYNPDIPSIRLGISQQVTADEQWHKILSNIKDTEKLNTELLKLDKEIRQILEQYDEIDSSILPILRDLKALHRGLIELTNDSDNKIIWLSRHFDDSIHLAYAPLTVKDVFGEEIFSPFDSVILTSATLSTYGNFNYIRSELGLDENFEELKIPSHFSYPDQVKIIIPEDLPEPKEPEYLEQCKEVIESVINKNGGRTMVLFTAKKDLARVFHDIAPKLKTRGISLLGQNLSGGRGKILSHFQDEPEKSAILGTNSFWEGVDLTGSALTCVMIQKLPFDPPDDPIIRGRSSQFNRPFEEYSLPRAILRFKQGFGRLIRSSHDTGAVIILDSRLVHKSYGKAFIASLPEGIKIHQCTRNEVANYL